MVLGNDISMTKSKPLNLHTVLNPMNILLALFIAVSNSALYSNEPHLNDYYP